MGELQEPTQESTEEAAISWPKVALGVLVAILAVAGLVVLWTKAGPDEGASARGPATKPAVAQAGLLAPDAPRPTILPGFTSPGPTLYPNGVSEFTLGDIPFLIIHFGASWQGVDMRHFVTPSEGYPKREGDTWALQAKWQVAGGIFDFSQALKRIDPQTIAYEATATSEEGVPTNGLVLEAHLPTSRYAGEQFIVDGRVIRFPMPAPVDDASQAVLSGRMVKRLQIATPDGQIVIDGPMQLYVQDNRRYGTEEYTARISFSPEKGLIKKSSLKLTFHYVLGRSAPPATAPAVEKQLAPEQSQ